ncbi:MAG TPA: cyclic nucleotide-binding domain-containing protein [Mariprofundaceae bacterium]|nr:cyclic nucleotide-binding domain-containing protein [Mariprofundaceae bacterium]
MARILPFKEGDTLIAQGDEDTGAYLIQSGWVQVRRKKPGGAIDTFTLGPGEIIGELGLAGLVSSRTATVTALTDGDVEIIDRGALIRLVNGPGNRLTPLLAALFSRLRMALANEGDETQLDDTMVMYAKLEGLNHPARQALCNQPRMITRLPWVFGAHMPPLSVTDLFRQQQPADVVLTSSGKAIREHHLCIEAVESGGLQLRLMHFGDFCELDDTRIGYGKTETIVPLPRGKHTLAFGDQTNPYRFSLQVLI